MTNRDLRFISLLLLFGAFIWGRDLSWISAAEDVIPILAALPVFVWLAWPWNFRRETEHLRQVKLASSGLLAILGILFNLTILLALSWVALLWAWLESRLCQREMDRIKPLLVLPLLAFPWLTLDFQAIGWWFRLSAATATHGFFASLGYNSLREGTNLYLQGHPISVEAACSGLHTLQSMLIAGAVIDFILLGPTKKFWWNLAVLIPLAWLANTARIVVLCLATIWYGPHFSMGAFHDWGGLAVLFIMFAFSALLFSLQKERGSRKPPPTPLPAIAEQNA
jgi:exosortase